MVLKKILRILIIAILSILGALLVFVAISIAPVDRTPAQELPEYSAMMKRLDSLREQRNSEPLKKFSVGFSKVNLTPPFRTATAGYGNRKGKLFTSVHDSIYVRTMVIDNGTERVAIVSADLLIIPPNVAEALQPRLADLKFDAEHVYLGATHSHNSIGNWGERAAGFLYGSYNDSIVQFIVNKMIISIQQASSDLVPSQLRAGVINIPEAVQNRLIDGGPEDAGLRVIEVERNDGKRLLFTSYTAHATCLYSRDLELSRDYPGKLVDLLESKGYDFSMFMAGAVGSHKCKSSASGWNCIDWMATTITDRFLAARDQLKPVNDSTLSVIRVPLELGDPQVKISDNWKVRAWLFRSALGERTPYINACRIGDLVLLGTPCDFSGEFDAALDSIAADHHMRMMVTSFNGGYIGYVTPARYYDIKHYETQLMNWYAPGTGEYMQKCLQKLIEAVAE
jgi:neutral ceramidase